MDIIEEYTSTRTTTVCDSCEGENKNRAFNKCCKCSADICSTHSYKGINTRTDLIDYEEDGMTLWDNQKYVCPNCWDNRNNSKKYDKEVAKLIEKFNKSLKKLNIKYE